MLKRNLLAAAIIAAVAVTGVTVTGVAAANDSVAEMTTGGLVLRNSRNIDMVEEDLFVSAAQIRVAYIFRNRARADERVIVAFPMPDRPLADEDGGDISAVTDFETRVEGRRVRTEVEGKAMVGTRDHSALLRSLNVPLTHPETGDATIGRALARLSAADRTRLERAGLIRVWGSGADNVAPLWVYKETHYWTQVFPAGRDLRITHQYRPGVGGTVQASLMFPDYRRTPEGRAEIREYCADSAFLAGADRLRRQAGETGLPSEQTLGYILRTGANWRAPIRRFRLVVDKGDPRNIVSFCGQNVRRISPTQFEMRRTNWRPTQDLRVLIIRPLSVVGGG